MDPDGDITDAFDDGELAKSIEAGSKGPWNDETAVFIDPKIAQLKKAMTTKERLDYQQRRMLELQRRAVDGSDSKAKKNKPKPEPVPLEAPQAPWGGPVPVWNEHGTVVDSPWTERRSADNDPDPDSPASAIVRARRASDRIEPPAAEPDEVAEPTKHAAAAHGLLASYTPSILAAMLVFVAATMVHGAMAGWQIGLAYRSIAAMLITGILWRRLQADRLRAMALATVTYAALFVPSERLGEPENVFAVFLGLLVVIAGAGLIGAQRAEFGSRRAEFGSRPL